MEEGNESVNQVIKENVNGREGAGGMIMMTGKRMKRSIASSFLGVAQEKNIL